LEARLAGAEDFVLISSDKAVHPVSVMGVTKRIAELMTKRLPCAPERAISVRFGNVLGSNGSVVPIFEEQIARGGPVTVTHPEMRRYFMTLVEAAQLVLQASVLSEGKEIFVLDIGEPVRIIDIAMNLIQHSGLKPGDIQIEFTGIRPGEKLSEELSTIGEKLLSTPHERIRVAQCAGKSQLDPNFHLERLRECCQTRNLTLLLDEIGKIVPEFQHKR
jgi:FlaA1/EpsC-like NDP-sugar epimerase